MKLMNKKSKSTEIYARIYIHGASIGKQTKCDIAYRKTKLLVYKLYDKRQIEGARVFIIENEAHAEYRLLNILFDYPKITKNVFPFTYAEIQPMPQTPVDLDKQMESLGFKRYQ